MQGGDDKEARTAFIGDGALRGVPAVGVEKALPLSDVGVKHMDPVGVSPLQDDVKGELK